MQNCPFLEKNKMLYFFGFSKLSAQRATLSVSNSFISGVFCPDSAQEEEPTSTFSNDKIDVENVD